MNYGKVKGLCKADIELDVKFEIIPRENELVIEFIDPMNCKLDIDNNIFIADIDGNKLSFLDCGECETRKNNSEITGITLFFNVCIKGMVVSNLEELNCHSITFEINSNPVPVLSKLNNSSISLPLFNFQFSKNEANNILCVITSNDLEISILKYEEVFFEICDILCICLGYYPFIISEIASCNKQYIEIIRVYSRTYVKGNSFAHWSSELTSVSKIEFSEVYANYRTLQDKNDTAIPMLLNVIHSEGIYIDFMLSVLIQCVEGYMRTFHKKVKFSKTDKKKVVALILEAVNNCECEEIKQIPKLENSLQGLLGNINSPSLKECLYDAFNYNCYTQQIVKLEMQNNTYDDFITKSGNVRNRFSHMIPKKNLFNEVHEIKKAFEKYKLLLRVLILTDLGVKNLSLDRVIKNIDT